MKILSLEKKATTIPPALDSGLRLPKVVVCAMLLLWEHGIKKKKQTQVFVTIIGQELPELTPVEIVGYEVVEARIPESLGSGSVNHLL